MCKFTIVLTPRPYIPATSFVLALAATWPCCERAAFLFLWWDKCSATLVRIPHCFGLYWFVKPTFSWEGIYNVIQPLFCMGKEDQPKINQSERYMNCLCYQGVPFSLLLDFQHLLSWLNWQWFVCFLLVLLRCLFFSMSVICLMATSLFLILILSSLSSYYICSFNIELILLPKIGLHSSPFRDERTSPFAFISQHALVMSFW